VFSNVVVDVLAYRSRSFGDICMLLYITEKGVAYCISHII